MPGKVTYSREPALTDPAALYSCFVQLDKLDIEGDPSPIVEKVRLIVKGIDGNVRGRAAARSPVCRTRSPSTPACRHAPPVPPRLVRTAAAGP